MCDREVVISGAESEYTKHLTAWLAKQPGWLLDWRRRNGAGAYRPLYRCTIEREPAGVVHRSIHPYVGVVQLQRRTR